MTILFSAVFFLLGAICASFAGVIAGRLHTGQSFVKGRSRCDACNIPLTALSLVPILSHVAHRGRARCCGARIPFSSSLTELLLGILFVLAYQMDGLTSALPFFLLSLTVLLALVLYDLAHQILPPKLLGAFLVMSLFTRVLASASMTEFLDIFLMAFFITLFLGAIHFFSRGRAMGFADAPLAFGLAMLTGFVALSGLLFSFWIGAGIGITILARRPRGSRMGVEVPFAPFLAAGFLLAYFTQWNPIAFIAAIL